MNILGISAFYHDSAAAILSDGKIIAAAQEERFTRKKHDPAFPTNAIRFCLAQARLSLDDLDAIAFYDKPFLKFERLLETYYAFAPKGLPSFLKAMPVWIKEKLFLKKIIYNELKSIAPFDKKKIKLLFPEHHLSHAASAFYPSGFTEAAILTIDGVGEWATASISKGQGNNITILKELDFPHSLGLLYSAFTYYCGFEVNEGEYKLMGLAPYGNKSGEFYMQCVEKIRTQMITIFPDGSIFLNQQYFRYATGLRMTDDAQWQRLFGLARRQPESPLEPSHCDLALAIQTVTEEIVEKMALHALQLTGCNRLCLAGGVALNVVANGRLLRSGHFEDIFVQPAAGDAGGSLGAAQAAHHIYFNQPAAHHDMQGSRLGPAYSNETIYKTIQQALRQPTQQGGLSYQYYDDPTTLIEKTATLLAEGKVIGWFQGRSEFGPRALGSRSILADPRDPAMQKKLNLKIKSREGFRPFAPVVPVEKMQEYFDMDRPSPYMLFVHKILPSRANPLPNGYENWNLMDKLYFSRSDLPSVTHIDYSARVQTVDSATNNRLWQLLNAFEQKTGYAVLINTSFNVRGEPIVDNPTDAWRCFTTTDMDCLVIGDYIITK